MMYIMKLSNNRTVQLHFKLTAIHNEDRVLSRYTPILRLNLNNVFLGLKTPKAQVLTTLFKQV